MSTRVTTISERARRLPLMNEHGGRRRSMNVARVLLVEDNPIMCRFVCAALDAEDMCVTEAHTGAQALELWASGSSDLVLLDTRLPDIDGFELVTRLRLQPG